MAKYEKILTPVFRVAFPHVYKATTGPKGDRDPKFELVMLFPKGTDISALKEAAKRAIEEKWPNPKTRPKGLRLPFRDGDEKEYDGYAGNTFVRASSMQKPGIVNRSNQRVEEEGFIYAGCWARATVNPFAYDNSGNRGVSFGLQNVQFIKDDAPFTGRGPAEDDFDELPEIEGDGAVAPDGLGDLA